MVDDLVERLASALERIGIYGRTIVGPDDTTFEDASSHLRRVVRSALMVDPAGPQDMEFIHSDDQIGDCVRAATATVLGLDRSDVPHFVRDYHANDWHRAWTNWIVDRGFAVVDVDPRVRPTCRYLATGPTTRKHGNDIVSYHMVVMDGDKLFHDPHPSRSGLTGITRVYLLVPNLIR